MTARDNRAQHTREAYARSVPGHYNIGMDVLSMTATGKIIRKPLSDASR